MLVFIIFLFFMVNFSFATKYSATVWNSERVQSEVRKELGECDASGLPANIRKTLGLSKSDQYGKIRDYDAFNRIYFKNRDRKLFGEDKSLLEGTSNSTTFRSNVNIIISNVAKKYPDLIDYVKFTLAIEVKQRIGMYHITDRINKEILKELVKSHSGSQGNFSNLPQEEIMENIQALSILSRHIREMLTNFEEKSRNDMYALDELIEAYLKHLVLLKKYHRKFSVGKLVANLYGATKKNSEV